MEYLVSLADVHVTTENGTYVPITLEITPANLGTEETGDYYTAHSSYTNTSKYRVVYDGQVKNNNQVLVGYIAPNAQAGTISGINGTITIKAYIDSSKILVSDTYNGGNPPYGDKLLPVEYGAGKTILTTEEWNSLQGNNKLSFKVKIESNDGKWIEKPYICKRVTDVTKLHTETCTNESTTEYCQADGYELNEEITYGNAKALGSELAAGDAFNCDVNNDGIFDDETERFYYVSPYFNTHTTTFDDLTNANAYATLMYYTNFVNGVASDNNVPYATTADGQTVGLCTASAGCNWYGPVTAVKHLPTNATWSNVSLKEISRKILAEAKTTHNATSTTGGTLPSNFSYSGKSARLLTAQEVMIACNLNQVGNIVRGELNSCKFLFERTLYAYNGNKTYGAWLETPWTSPAPASRGHYLAANRMGVGYASVRNENQGARPAIDVLVSKILK